VFFSSFSLLANFLKKKNKKKNEFSYFIVFCCAALEGSDDPG